MKQRILKGLLAAAVTAISIVIGVGGLVSAQQKYANVIDAIRAGDPSQIIQAIYTEAARGKGDGGGAFILDDKGVRQQLFSKSFLALLKKSEARVKPGEVGPVDFDPVTSSQDPRLKSFSMVIEKQGNNFLTIAVTLVRGAGSESPSSPDDLVVRHDFTREDNLWKLDDIRGAVDGTPWSLKSILKGQN